MSALTREHDARMQTKHHELDTAHRVTHTLRAELTAAHSAAESAKHIADNTLRHTEQVAQQRHDERTTILKSELSAALAGQTGSTPAGIQLCPQCPIKDSRINDLSTQLHNTTTELHDTSTRLHDTCTQLQQTQSSVSAVTDELNATQAQLTTAQSQLAIATQRATIAESAMQTSQATATSAESALGIARSTERDLRSECEAAHGQIREFTSIIAALKLDRDDFKDKLSNLESKYADQCNNHKHRERELDQHASSLSAELENVKNELKAAAMPRDSKNADNFMEVAGIR